MLKELLSKRLMQNIMALLIVLTVLMTPFESFAHDAYFLQTLIDENTMNYYGAVVYDKASRMNSEKKHIEADLGNFEDIKNFNLNGASSGAMDIFFGNRPSNSDDDIKEFEPNGGRYKDLDNTNKGKEEMVFTFPPVERVRPSKNNGSNKDSQRAYEIRDTLIPGINEILYIINDGQRFDSIEKMIVASEQISGSSGSYNGWKLSYAGDKVVVSQGDRSYEFIYEMSKGYNSSTFLDGQKSYLYNADYQYDNDVETISMSDLIIQANYTALVKGFLADQADQFVKPGTIEEKLSEFVISAVDGLRNMLGLYSINDLIYNQGVRSTSRFYMGVMPYEVLALSVVFHSIFKGIAYLMIIAAFIKLILMRQLSTLTPSLKISLRSGIVDLLTTSLLLGFNLTLVYVLMLVNVKVVGIFTATIPEGGGILGGVNHTYNNFAGAIMKVYYFFIGLYLNGVYIYRGYSTAVLIGSAPYYIGQIGLGGRSKQGFSTWWREMFSNIFLQSFHAFIFSMVVMFQSQARGIELAMISFALIPLSQKLRSMMIGGSGLSEELGMAPIVAGAAMMRRGRRGSKGFGRSGLSSNSESDGGGGNDDPVSDGNYSSRGVALGMGAAGIGRGPTMNNPEIYKSNVNQGKSLFPPNNTSPVMDGTSSVPLSMGEPVGEVGDGMSPNNITSDNNISSNTSSNNISPGGNSFSGNNSISGIQGVSTGIGLEESVMAETGEDKYNSNNSSGSSTAYANDVKNSKKDSKINPSIDLESMLKTAATATVGAGAVLAYGHEGSIMHGIANAKNMGNKKEQNREGPEDYQNNYDDKTNDDVVQEMYENGDFNMDNTI